MTGLLVGDISAHPHVFIDNSLYFGFFEDGLVK
ncbi:MAG: hypothetical protein JXQ81_02590 [Desulfuromonadales bacterium]|nr:hypothetical protein [Desulfuromonadales bacterium]MBN2791375.1 hypothetical protein [Desulfuromonadales bacterium]